MDAVHEQYCNHQGNIHRGIHTLSERSTARVEHVRRHVAALIGAAFPEEIIFTSGTTQAFNLVAQAFGNAFLSPGDVVVSTAMEHHSNLLPWQECCQRTGAQLKIVPVTDSGELNISEFERLMELRPKIVALTMVSNVLGTVNPVNILIPLAHRSGAAVLLDAAQAMRHEPIDVQALDCEFLCFSGHKLMGVTGTGCLYGKRTLLEAMPPALYGGGMVDQVSAFSATYGDLPFRFEAGTPNIAGIIGLGAAISYLEKLGLEAISARETELLTYTVQQLHSMPQVELIGAPSQQAGAVSFNLKGLHCYDTAKLLDQLGIAVRSGHHCAQPLLARFGLSGAVRVSPAFYNTQEEIDALLCGLAHIAALVK